MHFWEQRRITCWVLSGNRSLRLEALCRVKENRNGFINIIIKAIFNNVHRILNYSDSISGLSSLSSFQKNFLVNYTELSVLEYNHIYKLYAFASRHIAKNIVATGIFSSANVKLTAFPELTSSPEIKITTAGLNNNAISDDDLSKIISEIYDFSPNKMIEKFNLNRPIHSLVYSCFHRPCKVKSQVSVNNRFVEKEIAHFPWELLDIVNTIKNRIKTFNQN